MSSLPNSGRACLAGGFLFLLMSTCGAETPRGERLASTEQPRQAGNERRALGGYIDVTELPPEILYDPGKVSLVPDTGDCPGDCRGAHMVVYLVNDTDHPMTRVVGELQTVGSQMMIGGNWFPRDPLVLRCGTVPEPGDLPPRTALVLGAPCPDTGDIDGEIRYSFPAAGVTSRPMRGRYSSDQADWALANETRSGILHEEFAAGAEQGAWERNQVAKDPEDFAALFEIVRHHQLCTAQRRQIHEWIQRRRQEGHLPVDTARALDRMEDTLWKPWLCHKDHQAMIDRCVAALEAPPPGDYGSPERCAATVWRYLCHPEVAQAVSHADAESRARLRHAAEAALAGANRSQRKGAACFMARRTRNDGEFPASRFHDFLESGVPEIVEAGLEGLARRGQAAEAGPWMLGRADDDPAICSYYRILRRAMKGDMPEWEVEVVERLLEHDAVEGLFLMSYQPRSGAGKRIPARCEAALREALLAELDPERWQWWERQAVRSSDREHFLPTRYHPQALSFGLAQLDQFDVASDAGIFASFLNHPAGGYGFYTNGSSTRYFSAREAAKQALMRRHIPVPNEVVTRIEFAAPALSDDPAAKPGGAANWHATAGLYGLLATACLIVTFRLKARSVSTRSSLPPGRIAGCRSPEEGRGR